MIARAFGIALVLLPLGGSIAYALQGSYRVAAYWACAAAINWLVRGWA